PTFLFLQSSVVKEQTPQNAMSWPNPLLASGPSSVAYAALLISANSAIHRSELLRRQQRRRRRW
ncbi:hypothetical protein, partial [Mesorhizobium sp. CN2-181]|uniref:hypothetical protein n=1 Tax=Mesorhizobium yinganensis TaxID=3157707 RepID=UPI0032B852A0